MGWTDSAVAFIADPNSIALEAWAGIFFLMLLGKFLGNESRLTMWGICAVVIAPNPASLFIVGLLAISLRLLDAFVPKGG